MLFNAVFLYQIASVLNIVIKLKICNLLKLLWV